MVKPAIVHLTVGGTSCVPHFFGTPPKLLMEYSRRGDTNGRPQGTNRRFFLRAAATLSGKKSGERGAFTLQVRLKDPSPQRQGNTAGAIFKKNARRILTPPSAAQQRPQLHPRKRMTEGEQGPCGGPGYPCVKRQRRAPRAALCGATKAAAAPAKAPDGPPKAAPA